jgi:hypothetical protein
MANHVLQPWHLLLTILAGVVNREQQLVQARSEFLGESSAVI